MIKIEDMDIKQKRADNLKRAFNMSSIKTKALTLLIEHGPCCIFTAVAGFAGLPFLNHNPVLEFGFAMGGAVLGEYIGHRIFHNKGHQHHNVPHYKRYGLALMFGIASWGAHQILLHDHSAHAHEPHEIHRHDKHDHHDAHRLTPNR